MIEPPPAADPFGGRPSVSLVLVNWNTKHHLATALAQFGRPARAPEAWAIVVDNASTDGSRDVIQRYRAANPATRVRFLLNDENRGYAAAVNQGLRHASTPYVLVGNADIEWTSDAVDSMAQFLDDHPRAALVGPRLVNPQDRASLQLSWGRAPTFWTEAVQRWRWRRLEATGGLVRYTPGPQPVDWVLGACFLARRDAVNAVGGMDERYFMYFEEVDLCTRLRQTGWEIWYLPAAAVAHYGRASTCQMPDRMALEYRRSQLRYYRRFHGASAEHWLRGYLWGKFVWTPRGRRLLRGLRVSGEP